MSKHTASAAGGAMPAPAHNPETYQDKHHGQINGNVNAVTETYAAGFLRLMALRQSIEQTLGEMAELLDVDALDAPEGVAIPARAPVRSHQRREA